MCSKVLAEIARLQDDIRAGTFSGDLAVLRAIAECPFPRAFLDMLQTIDAFEGKPLLECVAAAIAVEHRIKAGRAVSDESSGPGQGRLEFLAGKKKQEVERFRLRVERQHSEQEQLLKGEQLAASRHTADLDAAEKSLREMREEEGTAVDSRHVITAPMHSSRADLQLNGRAHSARARKGACGGCPAARHVGKDPPPRQGSGARRVVRRPSRCSTLSCARLLAHCLSAAECATGKISLEGSEPSKNMAVPDSAWNGPEVNLGMVDLLRARGGADRAIECVSAAGQHLSLVCHVSEFVREARAAISAQCDEILQDALQQEVTLLQQDRFALA